MSRVNLMETECFPSGVFEVYVNGGDRNPPHFHVVSKQEDFDVRINFEGEVISVKKKGKRTQKVEDYKDIAKLAKEWLQRTPAHKRLSKSFSTNLESVEVNWILQNPELE